MIIRSKAPLRISFAGGGTDVPPFPQLRGGVVLSATINKYAYGTLIPDNHSGVLTVQSLDYDIVAKYKTDEDYEYDGKLDLVKAAIRRILKEDDRGIQLFLHSDAPPGSGLGSSSTLVVALIGLFKHWLRLIMTNYEIAELAYQIERIDLNIKGGLQDQYAAAFGGFNFMEFSENSVVVNPLRIDRSNINELEYNLLLCYTGTSHMSGILDRQIQSYVDQRVDVIRALENLKQITIDMKSALLQGRLCDFGALMHDAWENKKQLDGDISNPNIEELYNIARQNGVLGGKITGAGGGGYLLLYCEFDKKHIVAKKLEKMGCQIVDPDRVVCLQTWTVSKGSSKFMDRKYNKTIA
jgi:D-glycero-alpha-D-manno-heptose-7-phosphate kinase